MHQLTSPCSLHSADNAYSEAQKAGESDALCAPDSVFQVDLRSCIACINTNSNQGSGYVPPQFQPFIDFCSTPNATSTSTIQVIPISTSNGPSTTRVVTFTTSAGQAQAEASSRFDQAVASLSLQLSIARSLSEALYNATKGHTGTSFVTPTITGGAVSTTSSKTPETKVEEPSASVDTS